ncbi:hypothetical protein DPMN_154360 [Dreissena polymorpha]|uniref:Uncharacterized protein n=1 Tax=Dreissena polymorpha TaxID=45954 RepID=A0A9D4J6W9_DREPO|nr:hypothetical protein DPMN_154360 [Dreissena polymorpha]
MVACSMRMTPYQRTVRMISTLHSMKTKQLSAVRHRQQQHHTQQQLKLETSKLR